MQAERLCSFRLPLRNGLDTAAPDFAEKSAGMQREGHGDSHPGIDVESHQRNAVIDDEKLHQKRRTLKDGDVTGGEAAGERGVRGAGEGDSKAEDAA